MNKKTFYITTPIYYPSGNLHIGHVYTTTIAWVLKNYKRKMGYETLFLTGADEHGQKIQQKASENKMTPQEYVDLMSSKFVKLWNVYGIDYDIFSRTTNKTHMASVQKIFSDLYKKQYIYLSSYEGLYSISDEEFIAKKNAIKKDGKFYHPQSNHLLETIKEESYFLKLKESTIWLEKYISNHPSFISPEKVVRELKNNFLDVGVNDLSITRTSFDWGIKINENDKHVTYVWLDALTNYITMLGYNSNNSELYDKFWANGDEQVHIVGKEITRFHCIYWPIILHLLGLKQPTKIQSHGWIVTSTGKMSKSKNNVVDPMILSEKFDPEIIKYFLVRKLKLDHDGVFNENILIDNYNSELANTFGNLVSRTVAMFSKNFPNLQLQNIKSTSKYDLEFNDKIVDFFHKYKTNMDLFKLDEAFKCTMALGKYSNNYIDITMPWKLTNNLEKLMPILYNLFNSIYAMSAMLEVVIPNKILKVAQIFGIQSFDFKEIINKDKHNKISLKITKLEIIFPRIT